MLDVRYSRVFRADAVRLARRHPDLVDDLRAIIRGELQVTGHVNTAYEPHELTKRGGVYNGCVEFHLADDVLVLYSPPTPKAAVTMRRICTHEELRTGRFQAMWPM